MYVIVAVLEKECISHSVVSLRIYQLDASDKFSVPLRFVFRDAPGPFSSPAAEWWRLGRRASFPFPSATPARSLAFEPPSPSSLRSHDGPEAAFEHSGGHPDRYDSA